MRAVGIKALKDKLSEYLRIVTSGETVLVTDRDRVVAELVPPSTGRSPLVADAVLADAVRKGWITPPVGPVDALPPSQPVAPLADLMAELERDRDAR
jgi:antitoxin (DNA-binding transcriptional repressor) of toxin-antitoxin stability system